MEELYMTIIKIFTAYGWQLTVCALSGIFLLGLLKHFKVFDKIIVTTKEKNELGEIVKLPNEKLTKQVKKTIYTTISMSLSIGASALYQYICHELTVVGLFTVAGAVLSLTLTAYALYENFGVRFVLSKLGEKIKTSWRTTLATIKTAKDAKKAEKEQAKAKLLESEKNDLENAFSKIALSFGLTKDDLKKAIEMVVSLKSK